MCHPGRNALYASMLIWIFSVSAHDVQLRITTMDGAALAQAGCGQPFQLQVTLGHTSDVSQPELILPTGCFYRQTGIQMTTINGVSQLTYTYVARIDKKGVYTLGPAFVKQSGKKLESNTFELQVADQALVEQSSTAPKSKHKQHEPVMVTLQLDTDSAVVGQKVIATLRFYSSDASVDLKNVIAPDYAQTGWASKNNVGPIEKEEILDGVRYSYLQWQCELVPQKAGELTLPAYRIDYTMRSGRIDLYSFIFGSQVEKTAYSNAATLSVQPLPHTSKPVHAIGQFNAFNAILKPSSVHEGEGMTLLFEVHGDADPDELSLELEGMPESVKSYQSKQYSKKTSQGPVQCIEYILQARTQGDFEIPAQSFTFFDTKNKKYTTLHSARVPFTILPSTASGSSVPVPQTPQAAADIQDDIKPIISAYHPSAARGPIAFGLFLALILVPLIIVGLLSAYHYLYRMLLRMYFIRKWLACSKARAAIATAHKKGDSAQLYQIFQHLCASLHGISADQITVQQMLELSVDQSLAQEWASFIHAVCHARYMHAGEEMILFKQAHAWVNLIKKRRSKMPGIALLVLISVASTVYAMHDTFAHACALASTGNWQEACEKYQSLQEKDGATWYNMGNCAYKLQDFAKAAAYWQKAAPLLSGDEYQSCMHNLRAAEQKLGTVAHENFFITTYRRISLLWLQLLFLFFWYILLGCFFWLKAKRTLVFGVCLLILCPTGGLLSMKYQQSHEAVLLEKAQYFAGPNEHYSPIGNFAPAQKVIVVHEVDNWAKCIYKDHKGWVKKDVLLKLS